MQPDFRRFDNPLMRLVALVIGAAAMVGAFFVGAFVLTIAIGLFVVATLVFSLRLWWLRRQIQQSVRQGRDSHVIIEGEYVVQPRADNERDDRRPR